MEKTIAVLLVLSFSLTSLIAKVIPAEEEHDDHGHYKFTYGVEDIHTGDIKSHHEIRHGKEVSGVYTLREADGTTRIVKYTAGPHKGFQATVEHVGHPEPTGSSGGTFGGPYGQGLSLQSGGFGGLGNGQQGGISGAQSFSLGGQGGSSGSQGPQTFEGGQQGGHGLGTFAGLGNQGSGTSGGQGLQGGASQAALVLAPIGPAQYYY